MQIKPEYQLRNIAGDYVVVASGASVVDLAGSFTLNESGAVLWKALENGADIKALTEALTNEYDVDEKEAEKDAESFVEFLKQRDMLI